MSTKINQLENQPINRLFYKFAIPGSIGMLVNSLYVVANGVFIG